MAEPAERVVTIVERPDLVPVVAGWLWDAFWRKSGHSYAHVRDLVAAGTARVGPPQAFVLLVDGEPVGTASLVANDLDSRPDLSPWLAGVVVDPGHRGRRHVVPLIEAVEAAARRAGAGYLWLYTSTAERIYVRAGWRTVERFDRAGTEMALMCRDLSSAA